MDATEPRGDRRGRGPSRAETRLVLATQAISSINLKTTYGELDSQSETLGDTKISNF